MVLYSKPDRIETDIYQTALGNINLGTNPVSPLLPLKLKTHAGYIVRVVILQKSGSAPDFYAKIYSRNDNSNDVYVVYEEGSRIVETKILIDDAFEIPFRNTNPTNLEKFLYLEIAPNGGLDNVYDFYILYKPANLLLDE